MTSVELAQILVVVLIGCAAREICFTESLNQTHNPDVGSDALSVWNFCARFSGVISRGNQFSFFLRLFVPVVRETLHCVLPVL